MKTEFKIFINCITFSFCLSTSAINAQILQDTASLNLIKKGVDYIYGFHFKNAEEVCSKLNHLHPEHPIGYMFRGMMTYWVNYPLLPFSPSHFSFEKDMRRCIELCETKHNLYYDSEYLLTDLCARGMLLLYYADNDLSMHVIPLATSTYPYIRRSFDYTSKYCDFYFFTGLYNYYREAYPAVYPVYKTLAFLFPKGSRSKGIKELQIAAQNSVVLKAESFSFLTGIFMSFEDNLQEATEYNKYLHELYPSNIQYKAMYIKNLLLGKQYDEAEKLIRSSCTKTDNSYYQAQITIFNGILQEKKYHDNKLAEHFYNKGLSDISLYGEYGNEYAAYACFGLSRICEVNGKKNIMKIYRKQAMNLTDFKKVTFDE